MKTQYASTQYIVSMLRSPKLWWFTFGVYNTSVEAALALSNARICYPESFKWTIEAREVTA